jgi:glutamate carboxypeptidase
MKLLMVSAAMLALSAGAATAAGKPPAKDAKVWAAAEAARADQLKLLEQVVNIDSGSGDAAGGDKVAAVIIPQLKALGMTVETVKPEAEGLADNIVATLQGAGKGRILMIGHLDTVFGPGTAAQRPFRIEGDRARGPGVSDEKGGVVEGIYALKLLHDLSFKDFKSITFLIETSEERGSPGTRRLIERLLKDADAELNLEPADPPDALTVWRKGSTVVEIHVKGRAAHAGVAPQEGRNAAEELIHQIKAAETFPKTGDGMTLNLTLLNAGARNNIIPEDAQATFSLRVTERPQVATVLNALEASAKTTVIPDTKVTVTTNPSFPPLERNSATDALADRAAAIYAGLGRTLGRAGNGGASESALAADAGVAALDGLGPVGGGFHSDQEYLDLTTLTPRLYLLTKLIQDLGRNPPARSAAR